MRRLLFSLIVACVAVPAFGQSPVDPKFKPVHDRFVKFVEAKELSGTVLLVGHKDKVVYHDAIGMANIAKKQPMQEQTIFRIASMTKPMTAIAIMILQDEGKLNVDDPVEKHLPDFKGQMLISATDKEKGTVTLKKPARPIQIRDLLTHTSGLAGVYPPGMADVYVKRNRTLNETTIAVSQLPLNFEPGSKWSYCNPGIDTLGRIVEVLSGKSFEDFMKDRIFTPLGMTTSTFYPTEMQKERCALTYSRNKDGELTEIVNTLLDVGANPKHPVPAGGLYSTSGDLAKLYQMMLYKGELNGKRIISAKACEQMTTNQTGDIVTGFSPGMCFGFGWAVVKEPKGVTEMLSAGTFGHGGAFGTQAWVDPKTDTFYVMLIQRSGMPGGDGSDPRKEFQKLASEALKK